MSLRTKLMPYDVYERHQVVSQLLQQSFNTSTHQAHILDVGGRIELLEKFLPYKITSVNPDGTGHLYASGTELPFADNSFDAVVSIDTLEHLPKDLRLPLLQECVRVCNQVVIIAAPFGSQEHIAYEQALNDFYQTVNGRSHLYLSEHVMYGLPTPQELTNFAETLKPATCQLHYAGDYIWQGNSFKRAVKAQKQPVWQSKFTNLYNQVSSMALFHPVKLTSNYNAQTNRFYLVVVQN